MLVKSPNTRSVSWAICLGIVALMCVGWSLIPTLQAAPILRVSLFFTLGIGMLGLVFAFPDTSEKNAVRLIFLAAIFLRILLWVTPVSDDVNRYVWEGKLVLDGGNPYSAPASDPRWENRHDRFWEAMNHRDYTTAYPPGIQWIMAATVGTSPSLIAFKVLALVGDLITLFLLFRLMRHHAVPLRWAGFYAFNPVVLIAFAAEAHFDSLMTAALLATLLAAARHKRSAWFWLGIAIQLKIVCIILVPLLLTKPLYRGIWLLILVLVIPTLPFLSGLRDLAAGLRDFAGDGQFNAPLFSLLRSIGLPWGIVQTLATLALGTGLSWICIAHWRGLPLVDASQWMLGTLLVCSPIVHFWYIAWILPLTALRPSFAWTTLSITICGYFIAWWTFGNLGWWGYGHGITALIWLPWLIASIAQTRRFRPSSFPDEVFEISIVLPVLNAGSALQPLLQTLRREIGNTAEIIVVDGGSNDGSTANIAAGTTQLIHSPRGRGNQIAAGIAATHAPWILIVHADSTPPENWLAAVIHAAPRHSDASLFVFGQRFDRSGPGTLLIEVLNEMRTVFGNITFGDQTMLIRRSALNASGGFPAQPLMEDVEVSLRLASQGRIVYLGKEWKLSAQKWTYQFNRRFYFVIRICGIYLLARLKGRGHAVEISRKMYEIYYPETAASQTSSS
jgi:Glycosyl transferase family 2